MPGHKNHGHHSHRVNHSGLHLPIEQAEEHPSGFKHETLIIPSTSQVNSFNGSMIVFDIREKNLIIDDISLQFNVNAITGWTDNNNAYPYFCNSFEWITRIEWVVNNTVIDTQYPTELFIKQQLFTEERERLIDNYIGSPYNNPGQAKAKASETSDYIIKLKSFYKVVKLPVLTENHLTQMRVYMKQANDVIVKTTGTGTATASINFANVIVKAIKLPAHHIQKQHQEMMKKSFHTLFWDCRYQSNQLSSGITNATIILSSITGRCPYLFFVVRNSGFGANGVNTFLPIKNFQILDAGGTSLVGGVAVSDVVNTENSTRWSLSQYQLENNAYVYTWSFSSDVIRAFHSGCALSSHEMKGSEQLQITFNQATEDPVQVDIFASTECLLEQKHNTIRKLIL